MNTVLRATVLVTLCFLIAPASQAVLPAIVALEELELGDAKIRKNNSEKLDALANDLLEIHPSDLAGHIDRLSMLATQGKHPKTRSAAFAAWMIGSGTAHDAYWLARYSPTALTDFVKAIPLVHAESVRNAKYDFIAQLAKTGIADANRPTPKKTYQLQLQRAAALALASMTVNNTDRIDLLTSLMNDSIISAQDMIAPTYAPIAPPKPREVVEYWTFDMLKDDIRSANAKRSFASGKEMFRVGTCLQCHVISGKGQTIGPDLTDIAKLYKPLELLKHIFDPSMKIDEKYKSVIIEMNDKKEYFGTILKQNNTIVRIVENPLKPEAAITLKTEDIKLIDPIDLSPMPEDLLITLTKNEIWDLIAYLLSGNDPNHRAFFK